MGYDVLSGNLGCWNHGFVWDKDIICCASHAEQSLRVIFEGDL